MATSSVRALVVEDDLSWQQLLVEILTDQGMAVDTVDSLDAALSCMRTTPHRLAVVDLSLGGADHRNQDGLQVLHALHRYDPGCTALLLSGYATVEIAVKALTQHGAFTCLRKETFRRREFRTLVHQALSAAPGQGADVVSAAGIDGSAVAVLPESPASYAPSPSIPANRRALVVEDDAGWSSILAEILGEMDFAVDACRSYGEALGHLRRKAYAVAVADLTLANSLAPNDNHDGLRLLAAAKKAKLPTIVVSGSVLPAQIDQAYEQYGLTAFLEKRAFDRAAFRRAVEDAVRLPGPEGSDLTERELEVLALIGKGLTTKQIAEALVISENTVKNHTKAVFAKLDVTSRAAAVTRAISLGLAPH